MPRKIYIRPETWVSLAKDLRYQVRSNGTIWFKYKGLKYWYRSAVRKATAQWRKCLVNEGFTRV